MRVLGYILLGLVCVVLALGTFVFVAAPVDLVRDQIVATVKRETGRDLTIRGGASFAVYPKLGVSLGDVELSAPPEMGGVPFLKMASLKLAIPLKALLQRQISIDEFVLVEPEVDLRIDGRGQKSWAFERVGEAGGSAGSDGDQGLSPELEEFVQNSSGDSGVASEAGGGTGIAGLRLGDVRIVNGTVRYRDARDGTSETVTDVDLALGLNALTAPLTLSGDGEWKGRNVPIEATVTSLDDVLAGRRAKVAATIAPQGLNVVFNGVVDPSDDVSVAGKLKVAAGDVPAVFGWLSGNRDAAGPLRNVSLEGAVQGDKNRIALRQATFTVNDLTGRGNLAARLAGRTAVEGTVRVGAIRTASFLGTPNAPAPAVGGQGGATARGRAADWDKTPINFKGLRSADVKMIVAFESITHDTIQIGAGQMAVALKDGVLRINANPLKVYDGSVQSTVVIDARRAVSVYRAQLSADGVSALPLLKAVADFDWLSGATEARIDVRGRGLSQRQMMRTMDGTASLKFANGAVEGFNVAKVMRGVQKGQFNNFDRVPGEKTDFSAMSASFRINQGVAANNDLSLVGPLVRASGGGTINVGGRAIDYVLTPKLVASLQGQGSGDLSGLSVPLKIKGPWSGPGITPDLNGLLSNPEAAVKSLGGLVEGARKKIKSRKVNDLLDGVLGGNQSGGDGKKKNSLGGLLGDFLQQ